MNSEEINYNEVPDNFLSQTPLKLTKKEVYHLSRDIKLDYKTLEQKIISFYKYLPFFQAIFGEVGGDDYDNDDLSDEESDNENEEGEGEENEESDESSDEAAVSKLADSISINDKKIESTDEIQEEKANESAESNEDNDEISIDGEDMSSNFRYYRKIYLYLQTRKYFTYTPLLRETFVDNLKNGNYKKIIILSGAGISVASGIPDFRTPKIGLYSLLEEYNIEQPELIFDINYFRKNPIPFYSISKKFFYNLKHNNKLLPSRAHKFIKKVSNLDLLLMYFTQNIDNLEAKLNFNKKKIIQAHGNYYSYLYCVDCKLKFPHKLFYYALFNNEILYCPVCNSFENPSEENPLMSKYWSNSLENIPKILENHYKPSRLMGYEDDDDLSYLYEENLTKEEENFFSEEFESRFKKEEEEEEFEEFEIEDSDDEDNFDENEENKVKRTKIIRKKNFNIKLYKNYNPDKKGVIKPNIVFFGEDLVSKFYKGIDLFQEADLIMVMGTSLKVAPFSQLVNLNTEVPLVVFNRDPLSIYRDNFLFLQGDLEEVLKDLSKDLGWDLNYV